jgi:hypothetical protein
MMANEQLKGLSDQERSAWLDSMNEDETAIVGCAVARRFTLVFISLVKNLLAGELPTEYRLKFLQWLDRRNEPWESPQVIAAIEPMCDDGYQLLREAMKLGAKKGFDVIASWEVFNAFVALNPSLLTAIKMGRGYHPPARQTQALEALR